MNARKIPSHLIQKASKYKTSVLNYVSTPALVLIYHRVTDIKSDPQLLTVKPENFYNQIAFLKEHYNILSPEDFSQAIKKRRFSRPSVLITFDDGYADNYLEALPILEKLSVPAIFYISTSLLDTHYEFWWDELERIFLTEHRLPKNLTLTIDKHCHDFHTGSKLDKQNTYNSLHPLIKYNLTETRNQLMDLLFEWSGLSREGRDTHRVLSKNEVLKMSESNYAFVGAHTHQHPSLSVLSPDQQYQDIIKSVDILNKITDRKINLFSYPFGSKKDYDQSSIRLCKEIGFDFVCSNFDHLVYPWTDRYQLPRTLIRNWPIEQFKRHLADRIGLK